MRVNKNKVMELIDIQFKGNYSAFARELELDPSHVHKCLIAGFGAGLKFVGAIIKFCKQRGLDFEEYIEI